MAFIANDFSPSKQLGLVGGGPGAAYGIPGFGKVTSYSRTPLGGHYTYINQGPGYSHKWVDIFKRLVTQLLTRLFVDRS